MSSITKEAALARAEEIRDETADGANTATRVGGLLVDLVDSTAFGSDAIAFGRMAITAFLVGTVHDLTAPDLADANTLLVQPSAAGVVITGIVETTGLAGRVLLVQNASNVYSFYLANDQGSAPANRFRLPTYHFEIPPQATILLQRDWAGFWRPASFEPKLERVMLASALPFSGTNSHKAATGDVEILVQRGIEVLDGRSVHGEHAPAGSGSNGFDVAVTGGDGDGAGSPGNVDVADSRIINVSDPINDQDAATKAYVDASGGTGGGVPPGSFAGQAYFWDGAAFVPVVPQVYAAGETSPPVLFNVWASPPGADGLFANAAGVFRVTAGGGITFFATGEITLNPSTSIQCSGKPVQGVANPTNAQDAATKAYVDSKSSSGGTPGGSDTEVQFNDAGGFGGSASLTFDKATSLLSILHARINGSLELLGFSDHTLAGGGTTNDLAPAGLAGASVLRITVTGGFHTLTGIAAQPSGTVLIIENRVPTAAVIYLTNQDALSVAANRFQLPQNKSVVIPGGGSTILRYDGTLSRWVCDSHAPYAGTGLEYHATQNTLQRSALTGDVTAPAASNTTTLVKASASFAFTGDITPTILTADVNDWAPTSLATAAVIRASTDASRTVTGLTGGADGRVIFLENIGAFPLVLSNEGAASTAANRFALGSADVTLAAGQCCLLVYDLTATRWRIIGASGGGGATGAPTTAEYLVAVSDAGLSAERVVTDTASILWDLATGGQVKATRAALTGDVVAAAGSNATSIAANAVTNLHLRDSAACSVIGRSANTTGDPADIAAGADNLVFCRSGGSLQFLSLATAMLANSSVTNAKLAQVPTATIKGRATAGTGDPEDLTKAQATALIDVFTTALKGLAPASGGGTANFLRADGTWATPAGGGGGGVGTATPVELGTASAGVASLASPEDHVHPTTLTNRGSENVSLDLLPSGQTPSASIATTGTQTATVAIGVSRVFQITAVVTVRDASENIVYTKTLLVMAYRKSTGGALIHTKQATLDPNSAVAGHAFDAAVSTNDIVFTYTNTTGGSLTASTLVGHFAYDMP